MSPILFSFFNIHSNPNVSIRYVNSDIGEARCVVVFYSRFNVQKSYLGILWKSSCILALASIPWHPCLNQYECISGRKPPASLSTAAAFIVCSCRQVQEFDAPDVTCEKYVCVCVLKGLLSPAHSVTHSVPLTLYDCIHVCLCLCVVAWYTEK